MYDIYTADRIMDELLTSEFRQRKGQGLDFEPFTESTWEPTYMYFNQAVS